MQATTFETVEVFATPRFESTGSDPGRKGLVAEQSIASEFGYSEIALSDHPWIWMPLIRFKQEFLSCQRGSHLRFVHNAGIAFALGRQRTPSVILSRR
jgi:hypothetical protein